MSQLAPSTSQHAQIAAAFLHAADRLFDESGLPVVAHREVAAIDAARSYPASVVGFAGPKVAGTLSLSVPWEVLEQCHPDRSAERADLLDLLRELSNLLLGKVKTAFSRHGIAMNMGIPTSAVGRTISFDTSRESFMAHLLSFESSEAIVLFDAVVDPSATWIDERELAQDLAKPVEEILFF